MKLIMQVGLRPATLCQMGTQLAPPQKGDRATNNFRPISTVAKRLDGLRYHLVWR